VLLAGLAVALVAAGCGGTAAPSVAPSAAPSVAPSAPPAAASPAPAGPAASAATAAPAAPAAAPAPGGVPRCTSAELALPSGRRGGAAGSVYRRLVFTDTGRETCELRGFPGACPTSPATTATRWAPPRRWRGERGPQVPIAPGGASAAVQLAQVGAFDPGACRPTPVRGPRVHPPGDTASPFVPAEGTGCAGTPPSPQLTVRTATARRTPGAATAA
jgi:hypothetical protein